MENFGIIVILGGIFFGLVLHARSKRKNFDEKLSSAMQEHSRALVSYYQQTRQTDQFGNVDLSKWTKKIDLFLRTQVATNMSDFSGWRRSKQGNASANIVHSFTINQIRAERQRTPLARIDHANLTPIEYERHCGAFLEQDSWDVCYTPASGDGGADFIAEKCGIRLIAQVKNYSKPVGNKAVQEANSAVRLYNGTSACVIAPRGFTPQAQREAQTLGIELLHHTELAVFAIGLIEDNVRRRRLRA